jgi:phage N-6-adenine-methyltransferase
MTGVKTFDPSAKVPAQPSRIEREDWEVPARIFEVEHAFYRFTIDVAASAANRVVPRYFDRERDGLRQSWAGERVWMHPPHSDVERWVRKAGYEARRGTLVVGLIPCRTGAPWWHEAVLPIARVRFLCGPILWRLGGLPLAGQRKVDGPRGDFAIVEWTIGRRG